jgi:hypothetical protein
LDRHIPTIPTDFLAQIQYLCKKLSSFQFSTFLSLPSPLLLLIAYLPLWAEWMWMDGCKSIR